MKPILLATDYSPAARNAGDYAAQLAGLCNCELLVFHAWTPPVAGGETMAVVVPLDELQVVQQEAADAEATRLRTKFGIRVKAVAVAGFAGDEIGEFYRSNLASVVVMGLAHHNMIGRVLGSVATVGLHKAEYPMLVVPEKSAFKSPEHLLFATDLHGSHDWHEVNTLRELSEILKFDVHITNVVAEKQIANVEESTSGILLENKLEGINHSWHFPVDEDVPHGIEETAKAVNADWIAVVPHHLPWYKELFHKSVSKQVAFIADRPMLALPG